MPPDDDNGPGSQDPLVDEVRPQPEDPPRPGMTLVGFLGRSNRDGYERLYLDLGLATFTQFRSDDVAERKRLPADSPPFVGEETTRVTLKLGVRFEYTETRVFNTDDFALEPPTPSPGFGLDFGGPGGIVAFGCRFPRTT